MIIDLNSSISLIEEPIEILIMGFFDGLHKGHMTLMHKDLYKSSILTFVNIPSKTNFLYSDNNRIEQLEKTGCKNVLVYDVSNNLTASEFIEKILKVLNPQKIIVGEDFRIGSDLKGVDFLINNNFNVDVVPRNENVSTTMLKEFISTSDFEKTNQYLIYPYYRTGYVIDGNKQGSMIGAKTANIEINPNLIQIPYGVYISRTIINNKTYKSLTMVGCPKTGKLASNEPRIETHLLNYSGNDFYNEKIKIVFLKKIANIKNYVFKSILIKKIDKFKQIALKYSFYKHDIKIS